MGTLLIHRDLAFMLVRILMYNIGSFVQKVRIGHTFAVVSVSMPNYYCTESYIA